MSQIELSPRHNSRSLSRWTRLNVDLTPMVDLGFLLITFFILTASLSQPKATGLAMPKDSKMKILLKLSTLLTLRPVRNNRIDYFEGRNESVAIINHCSYAELRAVIQQKQKKAEHVLGNKKEMAIIIDPASGSSCKNFCRYNG